MQTISSSRLVHTDIPFRLDRLPWSRFHVLVVVGLGITWILDGLEVTIVGSLGPALQSAETLHLSSSNLGAVASFYVIGAVAGALGFGWLTDRFGRRLVFYVTLIVYLTGVLLSAFSWDFWSFGMFRMITGLGIGGEYAAVNSAIDELIPAKYRGRVDLIVNGSFWLGGAAGAVAAPVLLDQNLLPANVGWRLGHASRSCVPPRSNFITPTVPLYHYTGRDALEGILKNRHLWCFSHDQQDDKEEFQYALGLALADLERVAKAATNLPASLPFVSPT